MADNYQPARETCQNTFPVHTETMEAYMYEAF